MAGKNAGNDGQAREYFEKAISLGLKLGLIRLRRATSGFVLNFAVTGRRDKLGLFLRGVGGRFSSYFFIRTEVMFI